MMKVTFIRVGDLPVTNWSLYTKFTSSVSSGQVATKLRDWTTSDRCTGLFEDQVATKRTVRIRGKIKAVCCDLGQCSLLFKWTIWRPLWRHAGCIQFSIVNILPSQSMSARRAIFLQIIQLIFINCSFAKINTIVFANLQTRCEVARYFFANDQDHFLNCPLANSAVCMSTVQCSNYFCKLSGSSYRWWME